MACRFDDLDLLKDKAKSCMAEFGEPTPVWLTKRRMRPIKEEKVDLSSPLTFIGVR